MRELMQQIFNEYNFSKKWCSDSIDFYSAEDTGKTSFFLIDYIDATNNSITESLLLKRLKQLENDYIIDNENKISIKTKIQELFKENDNLAAQIDKNTSAIYAIKFKSLSNLNQYKNLIYSIEESPIYFRRFILPYTDKQISELKKIFSNHLNKSVVNTLSEIANQEDAYYDLAAHKNLDNSYELVIRLFSKIPFLQYSFVAEQKPLSVEKRIESQLSDKLLYFHRLICSECVDIDKYLKLSTFPENDEGIQAEIKKRLEERR